TAEGPAPVLADVRAALSLLAAASARFATLRLAPVPDWRRPPPSAAWLVARAAARRLRPAAARRPRLTAPRLAARPGCRPPAALSQPAARSQLVPRLRPAWQPRAATSPLAAQSAAAVSRSPLQAAAMPLSPEPAATASSSRPLAAALSQPAARSQLVPRLRPA